MSDLLNAGGIAATEQIGLAKASQPRQLTVTERLQANRDNLAAHLANVDAALEALKANPEIERVMNLVQRASGGY